MGTLKKPEPFQKVLVFSPDEYRDRRERALAIMRRENLDGFLMTKQESLYYFTGFDTFGYVFFQAMYFHNDGSMRLITRKPDLIQALYTSVLSTEEILIRPDAAGSNPVDLVPEVLRSFGIDAPARRVGYEPDSPTLNLRVGQLLVAATEGQKLCTLVDHSNLFNHELRLVKSTSELLKIRKAAYLADFALIRALAIAKPGRYEGDLWRELQGTIFEGGGDDPANELNTGKSAIPAGISVLLDYISPF